MYLSESVMKNLCVGAHLYWRHWGRNVLLPSCCSVFAALVMNSRSRHAEVRLFGSAGHFEMSWWTKLTSRKDYRVTRSAACRWNGLKACQSRAGRLSTLMCLFLVVDHPIMLRVPHGSLTDRRWACSLIPQCTVRSALSFRLYRTLFAATSREVIRFGSLLSVR